ncbi:MAG TPA: NTP transferase domain-containing protein [Deltaproteobacteria bacterium]|nr:NTP transferase domain-containing protein [Deltaproteobacteria bacterium]HPR53742.1 NTP transferase domain-containing protein [Deltaproteobacteria bacterium]HXK46759.1 NTP transferase domain-containing protein [Deltaproteobacteria bacterium]
MTRVVAIIQARMGSSRLPGKVLMPIAGKSVLWHIIHRLRKCTTLDAIAVATSTAPADDPIVAFAGTEHIECVRGPEDNVLERYVIAADRLKADIIVRVTGDAPLIDPPTIDLMVRTLQETGADFCAGEPGVPCIHEGFDPFSAAALKRIMEEGSGDPAAREHVIAYFRKHPERFTRCTIPIAPDHQFSGARISVDTPADFFFLEQVYARLQVPAGEAVLGDAVRLLRAEPSLLAINAHVHQKGADEKSLRILMRCDGDERIGLGHVYRCLALADELRNAHGCGVSFAMASGTAGIDLVKRSYYPVDQKPDDAGEDAWLGEVIRRLHPCALVLDVRSGLSRTALQEWRSDGILCATIDDPSDRRLSTDLAFYPPVPQVKRMDWAGFTGMLHIGWEWVLLRREFACEPGQDLDPDIRSKTRPTILVTMGGSDPAGMTLKAVKALDLLDKDFDAVVMVGAAFRQDRALGSLLSGAHRHFDVQRNVTNVPALMARADLAIASFGVTAYELAAMGVPAIHLCLTPDHAESASSFVDAGIAVCMGLFEDVSVEDLAAEVRAALENLSGVARMADRGRKLVDGRGAVRIAQELTGGLNGA